MKNNRLTVKRVISLLQEKNVLLSTNNLKSSINLLPKKPKEYALKRFNAIKKELKLLEKEELKLLEKQRIKEKSIKFKTSQKNIREAEEIAVKIANSLRGATGYNMGENVYININNNVFKHYDFTSMYSGKYKGSETHGCIDVNFNSIKELLNTKVIGHVITTIPDSEIRKKIKSVKVFRTYRQKQHFYSAWEDMYLTSNYHASTLERAEKYRLEKLERLLKIRSENKETAKNMLNFIDLQKSISAGNCEVGSINFAKKHNLDVNNAYRIDYLISLEDSRFTRRLLDL